MCIITWASPDGIAWIRVGPELDASKIADDYNPGFTGAFLGICVQDLGGTRASADFAYFEIKKGLL
jgi:xylan 1,4-beta-xylosidase